MPHLLHPTTPPQAYLTLLRAARLAFANDTRTLTAARARIRHEFRHTPAAGRDEGVRKALEAAKILRENVVQGVMEGEGEGGERVFRGLFSFPVLIDWLIGWLV